jgi:Fic family protein
MEIIPSDLLKCRFTARTEVIMTQQAWIWQSSAWPNLTYNVDLLAEPLRRARFELGRLFGQAEMIGAEEVARVERDVWSKETVSTAAIEGETLDLASVRSSVGRRLGIASDFVASVPRNIEGLLDVMESAAADFDSELTAERLHRWQAALFPAGGSLLRRVATGRYRELDTPMEIVSGPPGKTTVHYVGPPSAAVRSEMHTFLEWFNRTRDSSLDGVLRAGLAHLWFETIHPYEDGNGRVGRAIIDMALAQDAHKPTRLHGMSIQLRRRQKEYYHSLNEGQRSAGDVTQWLDWFADAFADSCRASAELIGESLVRARFWSDHKNVGLNQRQRKVLGKMLDAGPGRFEGGLTARKYVAMTGISAATAWRDIEDLLAKKLITQGQGAGRATYYDIAIAGWEWRQNL